MGFGGLGVEYLQRVPFRASFTGLMGMFGV